MSAARLDPGDAGNEDAEEARRGFAEALKFRVSGKRIDASAHLAQEPLRIGRIVKRRLRKHAWGIAEAREFLFQFRSYSVLMQSKGNQLFRGN